MVNAINRRAVSGMNRVWRKKNVRQPGQWLRLARRSQYKAQALAGLCGVTMRQLERYFDGDLGRTPQDWLNEQRMVDARYLLMESEQVKAVGLKLGYKRLSQFSRDFKRCYGFPPTHFREAASAESIF